VEAVIDLADAVDSDDAVDASVGPRGSLENLSQSEIESLLSTGRGGIHALFRKCALAVLNSGSDSDNAKEIFDRFADFDVDIVRHPWGIRLQIRHAPANAFVDGQMIRGIKEHLFAVLRDVVYITNEVVQGGRFDLDDPAGITNAVFHVLRNARVLDVKTRPNLVVCWGGHAISSLEYDYTKKVGYELGLRGLDVCTGCGPGAMKGPMKGATIGHAKQRIGHGRYIGITEPGIIAAEPPNAIVNQLVIMPDIEKRLEAFARLGHGIVVFPGGVGTTEEILYLLGILLDPANAEQPLPVVLTGPEASRGYLEQMQRFIAGTVGQEALERLRIIVGDPAGVARHMVQEMSRVRAFRKAHNDSYGFNWLLRIPPAFQHPFHPTHETMRSLALHRDQPAHELVANLRRAFSGIVAGNVKEFGVSAIEALGPYELRGDPALMGLLDDLLRAFVADGRMKLPGTDYKPCYRLIA
jgi:predicted Rossmann-fold nucleotide-binding protein